MDIISTLVSTYLLLYLFLSNFVFIHSGWLDLAFSNSNLDICELIGGNKNFGLYEHKEIYKGWCDVITNVRFEVKNKFFRCILMLMNEYQMIWIRAALIFLTGIYINVTYHFTSLHGRSFQRYIRKGSILWILFVCKHINFLFQPQFAIASLEFQPKCCF